MKLMPEDGELGSIFVDIGKYRDVLKGNNDKNFEPLKPWCVLEV